MNGRVRVVKVGGSLLDMAGLGTQLDEWMRGQPASATVLIAGGGRFADEVRRLDQLHDLGSQASHWICIQLLDSTAQILSRLVQPARLIHSLESIEEDLRAGRQKAYVFAPQRNFRAMGSGESTIGDVLPEGWETTSDTLAAWVAARLRAHELVLLKSCDLRMGQDWPGAAAAGLVDEQFAAIVAEHSLTVRWVNFRNRDRVP